MASVTVPEAPLAASQRSVPDPAVIGLLTLQPVPASNHTCVVEVARVVEDAPPNEVPDNTTFGEGVDPSDVE